MSDSTDTSGNNFDKNLHEAIKTFITLAVLIFLLIFSFYLLVNIFPNQVNGTAVQWNPNGFIFGYIMAIPFMFGLSLYPFGTK